MSKIVGVGFHKTGTTSLGMALNILGYNNCRGIRGVRQALGEEHCLAYLKEKKYLPFIEYIKAYDTCEDNPWYLLYETLDLHFPNSKFILTIREDEQWLKSCIGFFKDYRKPIHNIIYGVDSIIGNEELYLHRYQQHNKAVKRYFQNRPEDLLIVNWENGAGWQELCTFLNKPVLSLPFPKMNVRKEK